MIAPTLKKKLCSPMPKWSDDSTSRKTKDRREHALLTFVILALEKGLQLVTKKVLDTYTWALEMSDLLGTAMVLKVQTYICKVLKGIGLFYIIKIDYLQ